MTQEAKNSALSWKGGKTKMKWRNVPTGLADSLAILFHNRGNKI
jgi:hypothetical protein